MRDKQDYAKKHTLKTTQSSFKQKKKKRRRRKETTQSIKAILHIFKSKHKLLRSTSTLPNTKRTFEESQTYLYTSLVRSMSSPSFSTALS